MRRSRRHRTPTRLHDDYQSELPPVAPETSIEQTNVQSFLQSSSQSQPFDRRRLRSWRSSVPLPEPCQEDANPEQKLERRIQELLELQLHSAQDTANVDSMVTLRYLDINAVLNDEVEDVDLYHLFVRINTNGQLSYFLMDGWTSIPLLASSINTISAQLNPPPLIADSPLSSSSKKRKSRAHVLTPGSLSLIPFGQDERVLWTKRIFHFIGKMRKVLGDRRIALPWGGSIIDSVIGVYITQNVSDTFSSKAFMNIAAKFPSPDTRQRSAHLAHT